MPRWWPGNSAVNLAHFAEGVAELGGLLVFLVADGFVEGGFEFLALGEGALGVDFLQPGFEGLDFAALIEHVVAFVVAIELADFFEAFFNQADNFVVVVRLESHGAAGADAHHEELGAELLEGPGEFLGAGVFLDEVKDAEIAVGVLDDGVEFLELKKTNVAVMVLDGLLLELGAVLGGEAEVAVVVVVLAAEFFEEIGVIFEQGLAAIGMFAIGAPLGVHLEEAEIDTELNFVFAILAAEFANDHLPGLVIPLVEQGRNVETHTHQYELLRVASQRNGRAFYAFAARGQA